MRSMVEEAPSAASPLRRAAHATSPASQGRNQHALESLPAAGSPRGGRMAIALTDWVGFAGTAILIAAYFANQQRWLASEDWRYPAANLAGSSMIFFSLCFAWNWSAAAVEIFWAAISIWGIIQSLSRR